METIKKILETETTHTIWGIEDGEILIPKTLDPNYISNAILFESSDDNEDGTYPLVMHYVNLVNKIDSEGTSAWLNRISNYKKTKNHLNISFGTCNIIRESSDDTKAILEFKNPIKIQIETVADIPVIIEVTKIAGEFKHDYYYNGNGRQNKIANGFEIWFNIEKYLE